MQKNFHMKKILTQKKISSIKIFSLKGGNFKGGCYHGESDLSGSEDDDPY